MTNMNTIEELLREQLDTIKQRLILSEDERDAAKHRADTLEGTLARERDKSEATIEQLRQLLFQKDDGGVLARGGALLTAKGSLLDASTLQREGIVLSPSTEHSDGNSTGDQVLLERASVSMQHYHAEKLEHSRRSEAALLVLQSKDETIAKLKEEKEAMVADKVKWDEEKASLTEEKVAMQTRFESLLTESARLQSEVRRLQALNDAAATEFEVVRNAEVSSREELKSSRQEVTTLRAEMTAEKKRRLAVETVGMQTEEDSREDLLKEKEALMGEVERLAEELECAKQLATELESRELQFLREQQQQQKDTGPTVCVDHQAAAHELRRQLAEAGVDMQRCKFAEKEALRQRDEAIEELQAELDRKNPPQSTREAQTPEELEITWPVKEFLRGFDRVENSKLVAELRRQLHAAEQGRYDTLVQWQTEMKAMTARAHSAEEEARRLAAACEERQACVAQLEERCADLEGAQRGIGEERERLIRRLHEVYEEWRLAQEKWEGERTTLEGRKEELEGRLEQRQVEVEEVKRSLSAITEEGASQGDEASLVRRVEQLTAKVLTLVRFEYDARVRAQRLAIALDASERRGRRLQDALTRVQGQLKASEKQRAASLQHVKGTQISSVAEEVAMGKYDPRLATVEEANERLKVHMAEATRLHKSQVERLLAQIGSFEKSLQAISQGLPEVHLNINGDLLTLIPQFTPPAALEEVLDKVRKKVPEDGFDVGELLVATAERLWIEEAKGQRLQALLEG
ncbi:merozoite surface protein 3B, putative [Perkinsus marinus ATCC 50983]|uniref:Merozoite surface protein 3B, putative n=1 Tax=Perkinsus marinus (strain ATCC 50983 / TXsc) TaxID=423536 RepID=C5KUQ1_PERM5|nr:merozoite surface protein 3B, putative [Perkinsus marinus ATCC 50983]EER11772.1 merozoite surface protein 3B, putative [Perkinsus marinus ATCC 50983]|eukprot:XP_002779977.1 merozoite surface protein 3B, putative [Perkinsus marinus ATCC 50983]